MEPEFSSENCGVLICRIMYVLWPYKEICFVMLLEQSEEGSLEHWIRFADISVSAFVIRRIWHEFEFAKQSKKQI